MIYFFTGLGIFLLFLYTTRSQKKFEKKVLENNKVISESFQELIEERDALLKEKVSMFSSEISKFSFKEFTPEENKKMIEKLQERYNWYLTGNNLDNLEKGAEWTCKEVSQ